MPLETMIVSRDWQEVSVLECILNSLNIGVNVQQDVTRAQGRFSKAKIDALILDRDLAGSETLLNDLPANNHAVPFILISRSAEQNGLTFSGATFFFEKPISVEQAVRTLSATRNLMMAGRMRYHRHGIRVPVDLRWGTHKRVSAELTNLSYGGLGVVASQTLVPHERVNVSFKVPGLKCMVKAQGELAWADDRGHAGIRFVQIPAHLHRKTFLVPVGFTRQT
jgi:PilZ domain